MARAPAPPPTAPFEFRLAAYLVDVTPFRAVSLGELLTGITLAPESSIFYHLHARFFREPDRLPEYPNDFAAWVERSLGDGATAERLANLNVFRTPSLATVRRAISVILAEGLRRPGVEGRKAAVEAFIFCRWRVVELASGRRACTPAEFLDVVKDIDPDSIGHHLFTPKATGGVNDFAAWFEAQGYPSLAQQLDAFDPYLNSLEDNRAYLIELIETGLRQPDGGRRA